MKAILAAAVVVLLVLGCGSQPASPAVSGEVMPKAESLAQPAYPESARKAGVEGTAVIAVTISIDGTVLSCSLASSSGNDLLDKAAIGAAQVSKFTPGVKDGKPVVMTIQVPFKFKLADKQSEQRSRMDNADGVARRSESVVLRMEV